MAMVDIGTMDLKASESEALLYKTLKKALEDISALKAKTQKIESELKKTVNLFLVQTALSPQNQELMERRPKVLELARKALEEHQAESVMS